jgi:hypothetical protein
VTASCDKNEPRDCPACWGRGHTYDDERPCGVCAETGKVLPYCLPSAARTKLGNAQAIHGKAIAFPIKLVTDDDSDPSIEWFVDANGERVDPYTVMLALNASMPSTGEFTKHPRCANGCETARKWGTKPCEGFCEWLPQKTASPIDAGTSVRDGGTYEESLRELLDFWRTFPGPSNERKAVDLIEKMHEAVAALYFAAYWHPDRKVDEAALWTAVRDAAGIKPGQTGERLGPDRSAVSHGERK